MIGRIRFSGCKAWCVLSLLVALAGCEPAREEAEEPVARNRVDLSKPLADPSTTQEPASQESTPPATEPSTPPARQPEAEPSKPVAPRTTIVDPPPADEPAPTSMPPVVFSAKHLEQSLVRQGDTLPAGELNDLEGNAQAMADSLGERLTVVLCWSDESPYSLAALKELQSVVVEPYGESGVAVIGLNTGNPPEAAAAAVEKAGVGYVQLSDPDGTYFAQLAEGKLPRIYLLDAEGKVLWFDIEYSRSTRRHLRQAIRYQLETAS